MASVRTIKAFPFCQSTDRDILPIPELAGPNTVGQPIETTFEEFFEWVWRVRKWRVTGTLSGTLDVHYVEEKPEDWDGPGSLAVNVTIDNNYTASMSIDKVIGPPPIEPWDATQPGAPTWTPGTEYLAQVPICTHDGKWWAAIQRSSAVDPHEPGPNSEYWRELVGAESDEDAEEMMLVCSSFLYTKNRPLDGFATEDVANALTGSQTALHEYPSDPMLDFTVVTPISQTGRLEVGVSFYFNPRWFLNGENFLPSMSLSCFLGGQGYSPAIQSARSTYQSPDLPAGYTFATYNVTFCGHTVPLEYISAVASPPLDPVDFAGEFATVYTETRSGITVTLDITPEEYYPFDPP